MLSVTEKLLAGMLCVSSFSSYATVIVTNDYLYTDIYALVAESYDEVGIVESYSHTYQGAAKNLSNSFFAKNAPYCTARASLKFTLGNDITGYGGGLESTLFSSVINSDDEPLDLDAEASAYLETNWTFMATQDATYELFMLSENGGAVSYSLFDNGLHELVAESYASGGHPNMGIYSGILESFHTYTISMVIDRRDGKKYGLSGQVGDGMAFLYFDINDEFVLSDSRTHYPVSEPNTAVLIVVGLAALGFTLLLTKYRTSRVMGSV